VVSKVTTRVRMLSFDIDTAPQSFCHSFFCAADDNVRTRPRNLLFRCVKSLLLLWKPHSWF